MQIDRYGNYSGINAMHYWGVVQQAHSSTWQLGLANERIATLEAIVARIAASDCSCEGEGAPPWYAQIPRHQPDCLWRQAYEALNPPTPKETL